jgi:hypothetical protein
VEEIEEIGKRGFGRLIFLQNIKPLSFGGTKKLYWRRVLEVLGRFI